VQGQSEVLLVHEDLFCAQFEVGQLPRYCFRHFDLIFGDGRSMFKEEGKKVKAQDRVASALAPS
jgi:hypothetical protein